MTPSSGSATSSSRLSPWSCSARFCSWWHSLVRIRLGSPVLFRQPRPGKDARLFTILKFRTMRDTGLPASAIDAVGSDAERLTPFGRFLRAASLDELPELWNVLVGDMSIVGPRPLLPEYLDRYNVTQARRHEVRPGITGWAQVNGRNATSWEERFEMDVYYVDNRSLGLDLRIAFMTVATVFRREGDLCRGARDDAAVRSGSRTRDQTPRRISEASHRRSGRSRQGRAGRSSVLRVRDRRSDRRTRPRDPNSAACR